MATAFAGRATDNIIIEHFDCDLCRGVAIRMPSPDSIPGDAKFRGATPGTSRHLR